ncbi:hypothetical protein M231_05480 [Tremella mesenterica]|uniref:Uncharacterized protein n=1 Tax=Tremella mesenterica TaxID=5217 RepID=A0A4Q1BI02_TREME|nr:hypothetical protein M231_05480 [Tremella mesenterica]
MSREIISSAEFPIKSFNSPAVKIPGLLFCGGQIGKGDIKDATLTALTRLKSVLELGGSSLDKVVKFNIFIGDMDEFDSMNEVFVAFVPDPKPARTCIQAGRLPAGAAIEIECIAVY